MIVWAQLKPNQIKTPCSYDYTLGITYYLLRIDKYYMILSFLLAI